MSEPKQVCSVCGDPVQFVVPKGGDGSATVAVRHPRGAKRGHVCKGSRLEGVTLPAENKLALNEQAATEPRKLPKDARRLFQEATRGLSENTRAAYRGDLRRFGKWWGIEGGSAAALEELCGMDLYEARTVVADYREYLDDEVGKSSATRARAIGAINSLIKKLNFAGYVPWTLGVSAGAVSSERDTRGPTEEEWEALVESVSVDATEAGARDLAILQLLRNVALRVTEVSRMDLESLGEEVVFVKRKGGVYSTLDIGPAVQKAIGEWLQWRGDLSGPLFWATRTHRRLSRFALYTIVRQRGAAIDLKLWPHALRHSGITRAASLTKDIPTLQKFSGHKKREVLLGYIDLADGKPKKLAQAMGKDNDEDG